MCLYSGSPLILVRSNEVFDLLNPSLSFICFRLNHGIIQNLTRVSIHLSDLFQLPTSMKGGNGKVAYIDTEGTLYPC